MSWNKAVSYIKAKDYRLTFKTIFKDIYKESLEKYSAAGHKLTKTIRTGLKEDAKETTKEIIKAKLAAATNPAKQGFKEQEEVLSEG